VRREQKEEKLRVDEWARAHASAATVIQSKARQRTAHGTAHRQRSEKAHLRAQARRETKEAEAKAQEKLKAHKHAAILIQSKARQRMAHREVGVQKAATELARAKAASDAVVKRQLMAVREAEAEATRAEAARALEAREKERVAAAEAAKAAIEEQLQEQIRDEQLAHEMAATEIQTGVIRFLARKHHVRKHAAAAAASMAAALVAAAATVTAAAMAAAVLYIVKCDPADDEMAGAATAMQATVRSRQAKAELTRRMAVQMVTANAVTKLQAIVRRKRDRLQLLLALYQEGGCLPLPGTIYGTSGWYECFSEQLEQGGSKAQAGHSLFFKCDINEEGKWTTTAGPFPKIAYAQFIGQEARMGVAAGTWESSRI
jgi:hypothetical protein